MASGEEVALWSIQQLRERMRSAGLSPQPMQGKRRASLTASEMRDALAGTLTVGALRQAAGMKRFRSTPRAEVLEHLREHPHLLEGALAKSP